MPCGLICVRHELPDLTLENVKLSSRVTNFTYNMKTEMHYLNKCDKIVDAKFIFPVNNVAIYYFRAVIEDREVISICRPRAEAQATFDEAVDSGHAAFLSEQDEQCEDLFQISIGNVPANSPVIITVKYVGHLAAENVRQDNSATGRVVLTLPQVLNPRYEPRSEKEREYRPFNLDRAVTESKYKIEFDATLSMPYPISSVSSPKDKFKVNFTSTDNRSATVALDNVWTADHDFQMCINVKDILHSSTAVEKSDGSETGITAMHCLMLQFMPDLEEVKGAHELRTELMFVIDRSGSMMGSNIEYAKDALLLFLKSIPKGCRFQIIGFGSNHEALFTEPLDYNEESFNKAMEYQRSLEANMGGTEVYGALKTAFDYPLTGQGWYREIIFLTDGDVMNANDVIGLVGSNVHKARLSAIGIGEGASTHLVSGVARAGRGRADFLRDGSQLQSTVAGILSTALKPRASDLKIDFKLEQKLPDGKTTPLEVVMVPKRIPPILSGLFNTTYALFKADDLSKVGGNATITFDINGQTKTASLDLTSCMQEGRVLVSEDQELHRLAGKCQLSDLTDEYKALECVQESAGESEQNKAKKENEDKMKQIRDQIEKLSCRLNILSIFTALIGVDPKKQDISEGKKVKSAPAHMLMGPPRGMAMMPMCGMALMRTNAMPMSGPHIKFKKSMGAPPMNCSGAPPMFCPGSMSLVCDGVNVERKLDPFTELVSLQQFNGDWKLESDLAKQIGVPLSKLQSSMPKSWSSNNAVSITPGSWATALAIALFEINFPQREIDWSLIVAKAISWLTEQAQKCSSDAQVADKDCKALIHEAKSFIQSSGVKKN